MYDNWVDRDNKKDARTIAVLVFFNEEKERIQIEKLTQLSKKWK